MNENDALGLAHEVEGPVKGRVAPAADHDIFALKEFGVAHTVVKLRAFKLFNAGNAQGPGLEGTHARGDNDDLAEEPCPLVGFNVKTPVFAFFNDRHFFAEVKLSAEGVNLL